VSDPVQDPRPRPNHYRLLGLHPAADDQQIRRAYRDRSRLYHPDTTKLPPLLATAKFQRLNEAYGILSSPERRRLYDLSIGYSRWSVVQSRASQRHGTVRTHGFGLS
jgi:curved DNA-binding protein CbpA